MTRYALLIIIILITVASTTAGFFIVNNKNVLLNLKACTMEAKLCPDGSAVGRTGPNCEFTACPVVTPPPPTDKSGITGVAMLGPMCPVERIPPDPNCADKPYKTDLMATSPDGLQAIKFFSSDTNGKFSVDLAPGEYAISSSNTANMFSKCISQGVISVEKDKYTNITLNCDTGIR